MVDPRAIPRRAVRGAALLALTAACGGSLAAAMALAPEKNRYETRDRITHAWASGLLDLFGVRLDVHGAPAGHRGVGTRGRVVVANHRSVIDIAVLLSLFGGAVLSRADLATWPVIGPGARAAGTIFVERGDRASGEQAVRAMVERLEARDTISVFPEGTTFVDDEVRPFKAGAFAAAMRAEVPVVPVGTRVPGRRRGLRRRVVPRSHGAPRRHEADAGRCGDRRASLADGRRVDRRVPRADTRPCRRSRARGKGAPRWAKVLVVTGFCVS